MKDYFASNRAASFLTRGLTSGGTKYSRPSGLVILWSTLEIARTFAAGAGGGEHPPLTISSFSLAANANACARSKHNCSLKNHSVGQICCGADLEIMRTKSAVLRSPPLMKSKEFGTILGLAIITDARTSQPHHE